MKKKNKKMKRTTKEYNIQLHDNLITSYGTINKHKPQVVYLSCKTWVEPRTDLDFDKVIENIFIEFKKELFNDILDSNFFDKKFISNFEIKTSSLKKEKKNFFNFEIYLKQKKLLDLNSLKDYMIDLFQPLINDLVENFYHNSLILTKGK